jgi:hypothetical protein
MSSSAFTDSETLYVTELIGAPARPFHHASFVVRSAERGAKAIRANQPARFDPAPCRARKRSSCEANALLSLAEYAAGPPVSMPEARS